MEVIVAPVAELRSRLTHQFEDLVGGTLDRGAGFSDQPYTFACGITGGSTALIFLGALRDADIEWSRVNLFWGDERAVPPDHEDSNYGLAERLLLAPLHGRAPNVVRMKGEAADLDAAARDYSEALPPALDLLILGVGDDGHVCSLFPGHRGLMEDAARVIAIEDSPKPPPRRLTLTLPYVLRARHIWVVAVGPRKQALLQNAISRKRVSKPIDLVVSQSRDVTIFTDQEIRVGFVPV
jgi:6-phosphogluconolactonase